MSASRTKFVEPRFIVSLLLLLAPSGLSALAAPPETLRILQLNVWQEGTSVPNGFDQLIDIVVASDADVITLSEVRNYGGVDFHRRLLDRIIEVQGSDRPPYQGEYVGGDVGLITRLKIEKTQSVYDGTKKDAGSVMAYHLLHRNGRRLIVMSAHLDYRNYAVYLPRGYDPNSFKLIDTDGDGQPNPVTNTSRIQKVDSASGRDEAVDAAIDYGRLHAGTTIVLAGDFNDGSHLDWTSSTKDQFDRNGVVVKWRNSVRLIDAGFSDDFRLIHPDPNTHPGSTWPSTVAVDSSNPNGRNTSWTPLADERDRIDYIYRYGESLRPVNAFLVGPKTYWVREQIVEAVDDTVFQLAKLPWMSDHKGVIVDYSWANKAGMTGLNNQRN